MKFTVTFKHKKDTKGTFVFEEEGELGVKIGQIYVQKHAFAELGKAPDRITVTVETVEAGK